MAKFEAAQLSHRKGQEGRINDPIKAESMATKEDPYQVEATTFQQYLDDPHMFDKEIALEKRYRASLTSEGDCMLSTDDPARKYEGKFGKGPMRFRIYVKEGITPGDFRQIGDRVAEVRGVIYDLEDGIRSTPTERLVADYLVQKASLLKYSLPTLTNDREFEAGMSLTNKKHEKELNHLEAYFRRNAIEKELVARSFEGQGKMDQAEEVRQKDVTTWPPVRWGKKIFDVLTVLSRFYGG